MMKVTDEQIERAAKALFDRRETEKTNVNLRWTWEEFVEGSDTKAFWRAEAKTALEAALSVDEAVAAAWLVETFSDDGKECLNSQFTVIPSVAASFNKPYHRVTPLFTASYNGTREAERLDERMKAAGMFSATELLAGTPIDKWIAHNAVTDLVSFQKWVEMRQREFLHMRAGYDLGDKPVDDELYEWVMAHYAVFHEVAVNLRSALSASQEAK